VNERIKELKQQAGIDFNPDQEGLDLFAELIIIDVCNTLSEISNDDRIEKTTTDHMTKLFNGILEHVSEFLKEKYNVGVEE
jgi:uncharacterized protein YjaG (DUF416 family)